MSVHRHQPGIYLRQASIVTIVTCVGNQLHQQLTMAIMGQHLACLIHILAVAQFEQGITLNFGILPTMSLHTILLSRIQTDLPATCRSSKLLVRFFFAPYSHTAGMVQKHVQDDNSHVERSTSRDTRHDI